MCPSFSRTLVAQKGFRECQLLKCYQPWFLTLEEHAMIEILETDVRSPLKLIAETAADLMSPNPISIRDTASVQEAIACLTDRAITAVPVIDKAGRAVGVVSRSDLLIHERERSEIPAKPMASEEATAKYYEENNKLPNGFHEHVVDPTRVIDVMTPAVFCIHPEAAARVVVEQMLGYQVHRLFVVDQGGTLIGTISAHDILSNLK
jgi:CBS domain-containing protein